MPGQTIVAAIKLHNNYPPSDVIDQLLIQFNELNGAAVPKPGQRCKIPVVEVNDD